MVEIGRQYITVPVTTLFQAVLPLWLKSGGLHFVRRCGWRGPLAVFVSQSHQSRTALTIVRYRRHCIDCAQNNRENTRASSGRRPGREQSPGQGTYGAGRREQGQDPQV